MVIINCIGIYTILPSKVDTRVIEIRAERWLQAGVCVCERVALSSMYFCFVLFVWALPYKGMLFMYSRFTLRSNIPYPRHGKFMEPIINFPRSMQGKLFFRVGMYLSCQVEQFAS